MLREMRTSALAATTSCLNDRGGATAIVFAVAFSALMICAGVSVDYSRVLNVQRRMQADLDAAVLGAAKIATEPDKIQDAAVTYFQENWEATSGVSSIDVRVAMNGERLIRGSASARVPTTLMSLAGFETIDIRAHSEVELTGQAVEVSLVLDTTASMSGTKLEALQSASRTLISTAFEGYKAEENVRIGIVPFAQYVNVGMGQRGQNWLSVENDRTVEHTGCWERDTVLSYENCRTETYTGYNDGVPYSYSQEVCDPVYGPKETVCTPWTENIAWQGCVGSRSTPLDTLDEDYTTRIPGIMNASCGAEIEPLTNDKDVLISKIDGLVATGDTYIPAGLFWGWATLSQHEPFEEARGYEERVYGLPIRKILVLMTDGRNTLAPDPPYHWTDLSGEVGNARTEELCRNIKGSSIEIVTVAFEVDDEATKEMLRACASSPSKFFDAPTPEALEEAFKNIAKSFTPLRLTM